MTIRPNSDECKLTFIFPDFADESIIEFSLDGGNTFPYVVDDDLSMFEIDELVSGTYDIYARHPASASVPMGKICISESCMGTSTKDQSRNLDVDRIHLYPNPTTSTIEINGLPGVCQIELFNVMGNKCKSLLSNSVNASFDISEMKSGTYFTFIRNETSAYTYKIIKVE